MVRASAAGVVGLGPAASSAALAPNGLRLVAAVPSGAGSAIEVVSLDGTQRHVLTTLAASVIATGWLSNGTALVAEPDRILAVDLLGHVSELAPLPAGTTIVVFAPTGGHAFAGANGQDGVLIDLSSLQSRRLAGSRQLAAFSGDGSTVAWADPTGPSPRLMTSSVARDAAVAVPLSPAGGRIDAIALDRTATRLAVAAQPAGGGGGLDVLALPSGTVVARGPGADQLLYSVQNDRLAILSGGSVLTARLPGVAPGTTLNLLPDGAADTLKAFVDAQVNGDTAQLQSLSVPGSGAVGATSHGLSRGYVVSASANPDGTVSATARLIVDPSATHPAPSSADESLRLSPQGGTYLVSSVTVGVLHDEPVGPHVVSVVPISGGTLVLRVSFDSDLRPETVAAAITVTNRAGRHLAAAVVYDPNTRTATVTLAVPPATPVTLGVDTSLVDVDGQALATAFTTAAGG